MAGSTNEREKHTTKKYLRVSFSKRKKEKDKKLKATIFKRIRTLKHVHNALKFLQILCRILF